MTENTTKTENFTLDEMIKETRSELSFRCMVYSKKVENGTMTKTEMNRKYNIMKEIKDLLIKLKKEQEPTPENQQLNLEL